MKKILAGITLSIIALITFSVLIWMLYVGPIAGSDLTKWSEYLLAVTLLTIIYIVIYLIGTGLVKFIDWAIDQFAN